jgi:hypothetical protein
MLESKEPQEDDYAATLKRLQSGGRQHLGNSDYLSSKIPPTQAAEALRLSLQNGTPIDTVFRDLKSAKEAATRLAPGEAERLQRESPITAGWAQDPYKLAAGRDDLAQLERIEKLTKALAEPNYRPSTDEELDRIVGPSQDARASEDFKRQPSVPHLVGDMGDSLPIYRTEREMAQAYRAEARKALRTKEAFLAGDTSKTSFGQRLGQAVMLGTERGVKEQDLGRLGHRMKGGERGAAIEAEIKKVEDQIATPHGKDFASRFLFPGAKIVGQMADSASRSVDRGIAGATFGMGLGAMAGPGAVLTVPAGIVKGFGVGMMFGMAEQNYVAEAGNAYLDMSRIRGKAGEQIDEDVKQYAATAIGGANAILDLVGLSFTAAPVKMAAKKFISDGIKDAIAKPTMQRAVLQFAKNWALAAGGETATEGMQELVNVVGEDIAKRFSDGGFNTLTNSPEQRSEAVERILGVMSESLRGMLVVGLPGATMNLAADYRKAKQTQEILKEIDKVFQETKLGETNPQEPEAIARSAAEEVGVPFLHVAAEPLLKAYSQVVADPAKRIEELTGINGEELIKIVEAGGDIQLPTEKFVSLPKEEKALIDPLARKHANDLSVQELEVVLKEQDDVEKQRVAEVERVKKQEAAQAAKQQIDASVARIVEILENGAKEAGLTSKVSADSLRLVAAAFKRIGERSGLDPLELFQKYNLTIEKPSELRPVQGESHEQPQPATGVTKGRLLIGDNRKMSIELLQEADKSTFPHEALGHFYLELLGDVVERGDVPQELKDDYQQILDYMGAKDRASITEDMHEKWSRTIEKYLETGVAPSKKLRGVFNRFARFLADIYRNAVDYFKDVNISPQLRDVLDRIFATQEAIEEARRLQAATALIPEIEAAVKSGLITPEEGDRLAKAEREDREEAEAQLTEELFKDFTREQEASWKKEREGLREEVTKEANERREYVADAILRTGKMPDGSDVPEGLGGLKIAKYTVDNMGMVQGTEDKLSDYIATRKEGADHPDIVAEKLNFKDAYELVNTLANLEMKEVYIERVLDEKMVEKNGPPLTPEQIKEKAVEALHGEHRRKLLRVQMELLASKNVAALKTGVRTLGRRVPTTEALQDAAEKLIGSMPAHRVDPRSYQAAEKRAAMEAFREMAKGNIPGALDAKIREAINHERYLAATNAKNDFQRIAKKLATLKTRAAQERIGKGNPDHVDQINRLLERYNLKPSHITAENRKTVEKWIEEQRANGYEPAIAEMLQQEGEKKNLKDATINELRDLDDALTSIEAIAKRDREVRKLNTYLEKEIAVSEMVGQAVKLTSVKKAPEKILRTIIDRIKERFIRYDSSAVPIESLIEILDGGATGPWHDYIFNPSSEAQSTEYDLTREITEKVVKLTEKYMDDSGQDIKDLIQTRLQAEPMSRYRLMSIIFNMGTESSEDKMIRGEEQRGNRWTHESLLAAGANLSERDLKYIQDVWNVLNSLWPKVEEIEKRVSGVAAPKLAPRPFTVTTNDGKTIKIDGGYYPLKYDPELSEVGKKQETGVLAGLVEEGYTPATTPGSHRKARTGFAAPLLFDFGAITQRHLAGVIKDISHREFLIDASKLLRDPRIRKVLQEKLGTKYEELFRPWLKSIASDGVAEPVLSDFGRFIEGARSNVTTVALGYKFTTMLAQIAGLPNAFEYIQERYGAKYFFNAWAQFMSDPIGTYKFVTEHSGEMRGRWKSLDRDARYNMRDSLDVQDGPRGRLVKFKKAVERGQYAGINIMDRFISVPTWLAAYTAAMEKAAAGAPITEQQAEHAGDAAVRRSQGAGGAKDLSAVQRERGAARIFTMFMTPFIAQYGRMHNLTRGLRESKSKLKGAPGFALRIALITLIPAVISEFLTGRAKEDETPEEKAKRYARRAGFSLAAPLPYLRTVADVAEKAIERDGVRDVRVSPVIDAFEKTAKTGWELGVDVPFGDKELDDNLVFDAFEGAGYLTGTPTAQPRITLEYLYDLLTGDASPDGPGQLMHDLLFRRPRERNPRD